MKLLSTGSVASGQFLNEWGFLYDTSYSVSLSIPEHTPDNKNDI